jgi:two-component system, NtrC family, sensor histidine kinase PilS
LYFFALYRVLEAGLLAALLFSPLASMLGEPRHPDLGTAVAIGYLSATLIFLLLARQHQWLTVLVFVSTCFDIAAAVLITHALPSATAGVAMMLLFNISAASLLLTSPYLALAVTLLAVGGLFGEFLWVTLYDTTERSPAEVIMFAVGYLAVGYLAHQIGHRARNSQALADKRGAEVANLFEINELIIRRMRTGVLVVDADNRIKLANEAASGLLGDGSESYSDGQGVLLTKAAPELAAACSCGATAGAATKLRCSSRPSNRKCSHVSRACWPTAKPRWCFWTTPPWSRDGPNR